MSTLGNIGYNLGLNTGPIRRLVFCLTQTDAGAVNSLSLANAAAIANWRTKFNVFAHGSNLAHGTVDASTKFVPSPLVYEGAFPQADATVWTVEDYQRKMRNAPSDVEFSLLDPSPYILQNFSDLESEAISVYFITDDNKAIGILDGANLVPFPIQLNSLSVPYYTPAGYETGSQNKFKFRLSSGADRNKAVAVEITDGSVTDAADFVALRDATGTITSPATTGCVITTALTDVNPSAPATAIPVAGIVYGEIVFWLQEAPYTTHVVLASAGSLAESPSGTYTVNESALLTSGKVYLPKISKNGYDITCGTVTIP
jgi:hypothetical protein